MFRSRVDPLDLLPVLSKGRHRTPRSGGCFMEFASYLAGESWSDHPQCTHPLLAELARGVNDATSDAARPLLVELIPSVIGVRTDDIRLDVRLALRSARAALPVASAPRQTVMAVSILSAERVLAEVEGRRSDDLSPASRAALAEVPHASVAAQRLAGNAGISVRGFRRHAAPNTVRSAVRAIAQACVPDNDERLRRLLKEAIEDSAPWRVEAQHPGLPTGTTTGEPSPSSRRWVHR
jgi:hypothetical protein